MSVRTETLNVATARSELTVRGVDIGRDRTLSALYPRVTVSIAAPLQGFSRYAERHQGKDRNSKELEPSPYDCRTTVAPIPSTQRNPASIEALSPSPRITAIPKTLTWGEFWRSGFLHVNTGKRRRKSSSERLLASGYRFTAWLLSSAASGAAQVSVRCLPNL